MYNLRHSCFAVCGRYGRFLFKLAGSRQANSTECEHSLRESGKPVIHGTFTPNQRYSYTDYPENISLIKSLNASVWLLYSFLMDAYSVYLDIRTEFEQLELETVCPPLRSLSLRDVIHLKEDTRGSKYITPTCFR
uniref:Uncharacterized protein n=1 Tax=Glossina austeni TaxID=7395 RepID=A0A1A9V5F8_GLOAU